MKLVYFVLAGSAFSFFQAIIDICQTLSRRNKSYRWYPPDDDEPDDDADAIVSRYPRYPGGTQGAQARPEVEGQSYSLIS